MPEPIYLIGGPRSPALDFREYRVILRNGPILSPNPRQRENHTENLLYRRPSRLGRGGVIAHMPADLHAPVLVREPLAPGRIDKQANRLFADGAMAHALSARDHRGLRRAEQVVERVRRGRIFRQLHVTTGGL